MKIIINSDILWNGQLILDQLPRQLQEFFQACGERRHTIVIPFTTLLEFQRHQSELVQQSKTELEKSYRLLSKYKIQYTRTEPSIVVYLPNLVELIRNLGVEAVVEQPTFEDFLEAHKRACLHERPLPPGDTKSDEMRDLVIWMIALRVAVQDKGALLISRDTVHIHERGNEEANQVGLVRVKSIEEALEYIDVETPAGKLIRTLLELIWDNLLEAGLPAIKPMSVTAISQCGFIQGAFGLTSAHCNFKARSTNGNITKITADIHLNNGTITQVVLSNILLNGEPFAQTELIIEPNRKTNIEKDNYTERLEALKAIISGG